MIRLSSAILCILALITSCANPDGNGQVKSPESTYDLSDSQDDTFSDSQTPQGESEADNESEPCPECADNQICEDESCVCEDGFADCDQDPTNGCETEGPCLCNVGDTRPCYGGPVGTQDVGLCRAGTETCLGTVWGLCDGQVLPSPEECIADGLDQDCDGLVDEFEDLDGDGWTACQGDCCDDPNAHCAQEPSLVNPGAYDFPGNQLDDDCDGIEDNPTSNDCSTETLTSGVQGDDLARAMDICQFTQGDPDIWGVIHATVTEGNGEGDPEDFQTSVLPGFGAGRIPAPLNTTLGVLSSGGASGFGDPGYDANNSQTGLAYGPDQAPQDYMDAHNQILQSNPACPVATEEVHDTVKLSLTIRVPTNANGFKFEFRFLTYEYPMYLCTIYNDFFLALLKSGHPDIPNDKNISFDAGGNPLSVNNAFFTTCVPQECFGTYYHYSSAPDLDGDGCVDALRCDPGTNLCATDLGSCPDGAEDLAAITEVLSDAGGTSWLTTSAPVVPGEVITLDFHIWDTGDSSFDSLVLLDGFKWILETTELDTKN